jgi:hypothetical protein
MAKFGLRVTAHYSHFSHIFFPTLPLLVTAEFLDTGHEHSIVKLVWRYSWYTDISIEKTTFK